MEKGKRTQPKPKAKPSPLPFSSVPGQPNRPAQTPLAAQLASSRAQPARRQAQHSGPFPPHARHPLMRERRPIRQQLPARH